MPFHTSLLSLQIALIQVRSLKQPIRKVRSLNKEVVETAGCSIAVEVSRGWYSRPQLTQYLGDIFFIKLSKVTAHCEMFVGTEKWYRDFASIDFSEVDRTCITRVDLENIILFVKYVLTPLNYELRVQQLLSCIICSLASTNCSDVNKKSRYAYNHLKIGHDNWDRCKMPCRLLKLRGQCP